MISETKVTSLASIFRSAIVSAKTDGCFSHLPPFDRFPHACCGSTSYLLAEFLQTKGIKSIWVSAVRDDWSHAWLIIDDERIKKTQKRFYTPPDEIQLVLKGYGSENLVFVNSNYPWNDIKNGLIVDITADQCDDCDEEVYVGYRNNFYNSFDFRDAHNYDGLNDARLYEIYGIIKNHL